MTQAESLAELLRRAMDESGDTVRGFAARAHAAGHSLSHTTVSQVLTGRRRSPSPATLDAIAATAGIPRAQVYAAAGLPAPGKPFVDELPAGVDLLDHDERAAVLGVIKVAVDRRTRPQIPADLDPEQETTPADPPMRLVAKRASATDKARRAANDQHAE